MKVKAKIRETTKKLPLPPAYASLHKESEEKQEKSNEKQAAQETSGEGPGDGQEAQEAPGKRDWSKVNRGVNNGSYGRPVFWNEARLRVLKDLREQGVSYKEIAKEFRKSPDACRRQWYKVNGH